MNDDWWRGWIDPHDMDRWLQVLLVLLVITFVTVAIFK